MKTATWIWILVALVVVGIVAYWIADPLAFNSNANARGKLRAEQDLRSFI